MWAAWKAAPTLPYSTRELTRRASGTDNAAPMMTRISQRHQVTVASTYMTRTSRRALVAVAAACGLWMIEPIAVGHAQAPSGTASDKGAVIGTGTLTGFVENMDRSL